MATPGLDPVTGIYTYADGSTYQNPFQYSPGVWSLNDAQLTAMSGDQGAAVNAALGRTDQAATPWNDNNGQGYNTKPMQASQPSGGASFGGAPSGGASFGGASFGGGASTAGASTAGQNPYLTKMGNVMAGQMTDNFNRKVMPGIASQMMATGGYGGSRQGVIEANAMNDLNGQIGGALTNLYGNGYNTSLQYDLGLRNNDLGFAGLDANIAQNNFNNRLAGAQFGQGVFNQGMANNQTGINAGTNIQNTPMNYWSQFGNQYNSIGQGYGATTGSTSQQGNPVMGALGGAQLGSRLGSMWGGSPNAAGGANSQGWGTGSGYGNQDLGAYF